MSATTHPLQTIAMTGSMPITKAEPRQNVGQRELGTALADVVFEAAKGDCSKWTKFYADMHTLAGDGRKAFIARIGELRAEMREYVKNNKVDPAIKKAYASANVRISELVTIAKAMDAAVDLNKEWPIHYAYGVAKAALAAAGTGSNRGRTAKTWIEKLEAYVAKNVPADRLEDAARLIHELAEKTPAK